MTLSHLFSSHSTDLAIDLGTANTLVYVRGRGVVVNEPSIVAVNRTTHKIEAVGHQAKEMVGRTPDNIVALRPMRDGAIASLQATEQMLACFIEKALGRRRLVRPRIVIGIPGEITDIERRAVAEAAYRNNAREVHLVDQAMVAAIGAGLPVTEPVANMVVDIGGGTTDIAVIALSGIVHGRSVRVAGNAMDGAIVDYLSHKHHLAIGERTAENIKIELGSAYPMDSISQMEVRGSRLADATPDTCVITDAEIRAALDPCIIQIVSAIRSVLRRMPPELSADISNCGLVLTGGGALLRNLDRRIRKEMHLPVSIAADPLTSVVMGTGQMLSDFRLVHSIAIA